MIFHCQIRAQLALLDILRDLLVDVIITVDPAGTMMVIFVVGLLLAYLMPMGCIVPQDMNRFLISHLAVAIKDVSKDGIAHWNFVNLMYSRV
jgi:hypothetical protein